VREFIPAFAVREKAAMNRRTPKRYNAAMDDETWDVIVIGAGAAGLVAAFRAAERGRRTLLLEKNKLAGVKILMSGGTRCNITQATDNRGIVEAYGPAGRFLHSALAALSVADTVAMFEAEGVKTKVEETGKIFPVSNKASDVLDALLARLKRSGAQLSLAESVERIERAAGGSTVWHVGTPRRTLHANNIILTTGGQSYPGSGTTGDGYRFAAALGHTIVPPRPALAPLTTSASWVHDLRGVTLLDVTVSIVESGRRLAERRGSLLFAHFGLSGPAALDVSRVVSGHQQPAALTAEVDLLPDMKEPAVADWLRTESGAAGKKQLALVLAQLMPRRIADAVLLLAAVPNDHRCAEFSKEERQRVAGLIKHLPIPLTGTLGFKKAEVTAGGVSLAEVDSSTMQSKLAPNLFFAGEVLDLDGPIGGYNFQAAWSTGWLAGESV
jgi:predicted Rossmann fold flavoprotein